MKALVLLLAVLAITTHGLDIDEVLSRAKRSLDAQAKSRMEEGAQSSSRKKVTKR